MSHPPRVATKKPKSEYTYPARKCAWTKCDNVHTNRSLYCSGNCHKEQRREDARNRILAERVMFRKFLKAKNDTAPELVLTPPAIVERVVPVVAPRQLARFCPPCERSTMHIEYEPGYWRCSACNHVRIDGKTEDPRLYTEVLPQSAGARWLVYEKAEQEVML